MDNITLRPAAPQDRALLAAIYTSTRVEEMAMVPHWTEEQKQAFLTHQFNAQHNYYQQVYPDAQYSIILSHGVPAGRIYIEREAIPDNIRVIDITLLPDFRGQGIGEYLFKQLQAEARQAGKILSIHVEQNNRARHLYERLGFKVIKETHGIYLLMEWTPPKPINP